VAGDIFIAAIQVKNAFPTRCDYNAHLRRRESLPTISILIMFRFEYLLIAFAARNVPVVKDMVPETIIREKHIVRVYVQFDPVAGLTRGKVTTSA